MGDKKYSEIFIERELEKLQASAAATSVSGFGAFATGPYAALSSGNLMFGGSLNEGARLPSTAQASATITTASAAATSVSGFGAFATGPYAALSSGNLMFGGSLNEGARLPSTAQASATITTDDEALSQHPAQTATATSDQIRFARPGNDAPVQADGVPESKHSD